MNNEDTRQGKSKKSMEVSAKFSFYALLSMTLLIILLLTVI